MALNLSVIRLDRVLKDFVFLIVNIFDDLSIVMIYYPQPETIPNEWELLGIFNFFKHLKFT